MKNSYPFTDKELESAAKEVICAIAESVPPASEFRHEFSPAARERMSVLFNRVRRRERKRTVFRSVAAVFILLLATVTVWLSADAEARETVLRWVRETFEFGVVYKLESTVKPADTLPKYEITWLPDGFELVDLYENDHLYSAVYDDKDSNYGFVFEYRVIQDVTITRVNFEDNTEYEKVVINGVDGDYYSDDEANELIWFNEEECIQFDINSNLERDVILKIAEKIKRK